MFGFLQWRFRRTRPGSTDQRRIGPLSMLALLSLLLTVGCGVKSSPFQGTPSRVPEEESEGPAGEVYTADDVARTGATTVWEALDRLVRYAVFSETSRGKPDRIRKRGASTFALREDMLIVLDGVKVLDITSLGEMPAGVITRIQVLSGLDGTTRYGTGATDGVIIISTRAPKP